MCFHTFPFLFEGLTNQLFWSPSRKEFFFMQSAQFARLSKGFLPCLDVATLHAVSILVSSGGCGSDLKERKQALCSIQLTRLQLSSTNYAQALQSFLLDFSLLLVFKDLNLSNLEHIAKKLLSFQKGQDLHALKQKRRTLWCFLVAMIKNGFFFLMRLCKCKLHRSVLGMSRMSESQLKRSFEKK